MSELAQRIITSHKEAAKRAVAHLGQTRKLKLSPTESLELVAAVLGIANWQTLLALAKAGRGPRIDDGKPAPIAETVKEVSNSTRLSEYFATPEGWGEHPQVPRKDWRYLVDNNDTGLGYWEHVEAECDRLGIMLPWERDAMFDYKVTQAAGVSVEWSSDEEPENDWLICDRWGYIFESNGSTEKEALQKATSSILRHVSDVIKMNAADFERYSEDDWLAAIARVHAPLFAAEFQPEDAEANDLDNSPSDELDNGYSLLPGEMTKDSRKFCGNVALCRSLDIKPEYSAERTDEGYYWTIDEEEFFATEADAWNSEAKRLRAEVLSVTDIVPATWDCYSLDQKIELVKRYCLFPFA